MTRVRPLMERNFLEYASYVIVDRAIPDLADGLKPVQRRILATLFNTDDGKFHKVANVIGDTMKLHPHGDASIGDALVVLANKNYFIERQGNFGNPTTGHRAAAPRYIECRLTDLARDTLFNKALTEFRPSYDGRNKEPVLLPAKLPVLLMLGAEGIAVGMATRILPHNMIELLEAQVKILLNEPFEVFPDFPTGAIVDVSEFDDGRGKVKIRALIDKTSDKTVTIREIPYSTTTESLIASIENAAQKGKIKIGSIDDFTTDKVEIEVGLPRGVHADEIIPRLYAHTDCEVSLSSSMVVIRHRRPEETTVSDALCVLTAQLREQIRAELELELANLSDRKHWLTLERIFIENRIYKRIEEATSKDQVKFEVYSGLEPFSHLLDRSVSDDDIERLLEIPIRRISLYDMNKNREDLRKTEAAIKVCNAKLRKLTATTISYLEELIEKYREQFPRRSVIASFESVDVKSVARANIKLSFDPDTGFFGSDVKGSKYQLTVSEYDRLLIICKDGSFRIIAPEEKVLIPGRVIYLETFDEKKGIAFTVVYRDKNRVGYAKRVHIKAFIRDREYELIKDRAGSVDFLLEGEADLLVHMDFAPAKRQRVNHGTFDLADVSLKGVTARGYRLSPKPIARIKKLKRDQVVEETPDVAETPVAEQPSLFDED